MTAVIHWNREDQSARDQTEVMGVETEQKPHVLHHQHVLSFHIRAHAYALKQTDEKQHRMSSGDETW